MSYSSNTQNSNSKEFKQSEKKQDKSNIYLTALVYTDISGDLNTAHNMSTNIDYNNLFRSLNEYMTELTTDKTLLQKSQKFIENLKSKS